MASDVDINRALAALTATLNEQQLDSFDPQRAREVVGPEGFTVDEGGGVHDSSGARVGALRRTSSGEWIAERQNDTAENADAAIPSAPEPSKLERMVSRLKP